LLPTKKKNDNVEYIRAYLVLAIEYPNFNRSPMKAKKYIKQLYRALGIIVLEANEYYYFTKLLPSLYLNEFELFDRPALAGYEQESQALPRYFSPSASDCETFVHTYVGKCLTEALTEALPVMKMMSAIIYKSKEKELFLIGEERHCITLSERADLSEHLDEFEDWLAASDWAGSVKLRTEESLNTSRLRT
jgi:hypothetical protein